MKAGLLGTIALLAGPAMVAAPALAQGDSTQAITQPDRVQDMMITAQRREQALQDVPIAVTAFTAEGLESRGISNTLGLVGQVPNMFGSNNSGLGSSNIYYIRGLGNSEPLATFDPPVGTYVDDIYLSRQIGNNFAFFDVERVEVLRGPQGTLFGRNSTGGAINVIMRQPGDMVSGFVEGGYGAYDRKLLRGSIDLPMDEMVALKLSGYWADDDGYAYNSTTGQRTNDEDMAGLRLAARITPAERLSWNFAVSYTEANGENLLNFECDPADPSRCGGRFVTTGMLTDRRAGGVPQYSQEVSGRKANLPLGNDVATTLISSNLEWAGDHHRLNLITGYVDMSQQFAIDLADGRALPNVGNPVPPVRGFANGGFAILNDGKHSQFSQEIKLSGNLGGGLIDYVAGVYLYDENNRTDFADLFTMDSGTPTGDPLLLADRTVKNGTSATAGYAQFDVRISEPFTATAGIRYTDETKTFSIADNRADCPPDAAAVTCLNNNLVAANGVAIPRSLNSKLWTPRFALSYRPSQDVLLFASATRGFRSGGWDGRGIRRDTLLPFDPETVWSYEAGLRSEWLDNRLRVNVTAIFLDVSDLQTPSAFTDPVSGAVTAVTQNFADYENKGLELELAAVPVDGLNLYLNLGYQSDKYKVRDTLQPNEFGVKAVRQQQLDCVAQLANGQIPLAPAGPLNAPDCGVGIVDVNGGIATPVRTPDWTLGFGGSYHWPIPYAGIVLVPAVNILYRGALETGTANASIWTGAAPPAADGSIFPANPFGGDFITGSRTDAHWQVGASVAIRTDDGNWQLILECENCFDEAYGQSSLANTTYLSPPRSWMLRARRRF